MTKPIGHPSMSGAMARRKGATAERHVINWLNNNGFPNAKDFPAHA